MENQTPVTPASGEMPAIQKFQVKFDGQKLTNQLGAIICECVPELPDTSNYAGNYKVRMRQIESIVNMHEEVIETLKVLRKTFSTERGEDKYLDKAEELIKQAEQLKK